MLHPFHIHGSRFRILSENGQPVAPHRAGWKDIVKVEGGRSEVLVRFDHTAPRAGLHGPLPSAGARGYRHDALVHGGRVKEWPERGHLFISLVRSHYLRTPHTPRHKSV